MPKRNKTGFFRRVDVQVSVFTVVVAVVCCSLMSVLFYNVTHYDMIRSLEDRVNAIHDFIADNIDKRTFIDINTSEDIDTKLYKEAHAIFKNAQDMTGVMYLYSGKRTEEGELVYVVDCIDPAAEDFRHPGDPIESEIIPEMERALGGEAVMPHKIKNTDWGKIFIAYLPVHVDDKVVGVIGVEFEAGHQYNTYQFLMLVTPFVAAVISLLCSLIAKHLFRRISNPLYKDMFNTDFLTNLKSRNAFEVDLKNLSARRSYEGIGFYVIDLNNLKKVNDTLGHEAGDFYLQTASAAFQEEAGEDITVYRTGGDEFVLLSINGTMENMRELSERLIRSFDKKKPSWEMELSFSIGTALYDPSTDDSLDDTYKRADRRMYEKKREFHAKEESAVRL